MLQLPAHHPKRENEFLRHVLDRIQTGLVVYDVSGHPVFANQHAERILGIGEAASNGRTEHSDHVLFLADRETRIPPERLPFMHDATATPAAMEAFARHPDAPRGERINIEWDALGDDSDLPEGMVVTFRSIERLGESENRPTKTTDGQQYRTELLESIVDNMDEGVLVIDSQGNILMRNSRANELIGAIDMCSELYERYRMFMPDGDELFPIDQLPLAKAIRGESTDDVEMRLRDPARPNEFSLSITGRPLSGNRGVVLVRDLTELRKSQAELRQTIDDLTAKTNTMETVFDTISDGVLVADTDGSFTLFNASAERMVGMGAQDIAPGEWVDTYGLFLRDQATPFPIDELPLARAIRGKHSDNVEMFMRNPNNPDGTYLSSSGRPLRDENEEVVGGVVVFRDVSAHVQTEEALLEAFSEGRLEILDTVLHNIGNAVNSVATGLSTLNEELGNNRLLDRFSAVARALSEQQDDLTVYLTTDPLGRQTVPFITALSGDFVTQRSKLLKITERVAKQVDHISDIIRTQKSFGNGVAARKEIELSRAIDDAVTIVRNAHEKTDIDIGVDVDCRAAPKVIWVNESKFNQLLVNTVKNAIEAVHELAESDGLEKMPRIRIRAYVSGKDLVIDVVDNGIGIEKNRNRKIFYPGYTTKTHGFGLGLHSAANYVIGTGGSIEALSEGHGQGTTIRVRFRLASVVDQGRT